MAIWSILRPFGIFHAHLEGLWYIFPALVCCSKINLATLDESLATTIVVGVPARPLNHGGQFSLTINFFKSSH
jgi:hypothetical protein